MSGKLAVAFRADATRELGTGHVMRCLTLASGVTARGGHCTFISRRLPEALSDLVRSAGHEIYEIVGDDFGADAEESRKLIRRRVDWLVVDHYQLAYEWESAMRGCASRVMVIDDLADRRHDCDVLLDQNLHSDPEARYGNLVPPECRRLFGPRYALLREEFLEARRNIQPRSGQVHRLLVFFGGMDEANLTNVALRTIADLPVMPPEVDVVVGAQNRHLNSIRAFCTARRFRLHVQSGRMADLMAGADVSLGAGGSTTWERCCLGVPTYVVVAADNQREVARQADAAGLVYAPVLAGAPPGAPLPHLEEFLADGELLRNMSSRCLQAVDGRGVARVLRAMGLFDLEIRLATGQDVRNLYEWRNSPQIRNVSRTPDPLSWDEHVSWAAGVLEDENRHLLIGERQGRPVGVVRFDVQGDNAEVSIYKVPTEARRGVGSDLLAAAETWLGHNCPSVCVLRAHVLPDNLASQRMFRAAGYEVSGVTYFKRLN